MYAHMSVECIWVCLCVELNTLVCMGMSVCGDARVSIYGFVCLWICTCECIWLCLCVYAHMNIYGYVCV